MDIDEIDQALDMRLILSYVGNFPVSQFSKTKGLSFQAGILFGKENMEISCFIPDDLEENREVSIFLAQNKIKRYKKNFVLNFTFESPDVFRALHSTVGGMRSMVLDNLILSNGLYHISFRFSSKDLTNVSDTLMKYTTLIDDVGVEYMGVNPGISNVAGEISELTPLIRFQFVFEPPENAINNDLLNALGSEWVSEARFMSSASTFSQLIRTPEKVANPEKQGLYVVDDNSNLYEAEMEIPLMNSYFMKSYDFRMLRFQRSMHFKDGKFMVSVIVPEILATDYLRILSEVSNEFQDWHLTIMNVRKISSL